MALTVPHSTTAFGLVDLFDAAHEAAEGQVTIGGWQLWYCFGHDPNLGAMTLQATQLLVLFPQARVQKVSSVCLVPVLPQWWCQPGMLS